MSLLSNERSKAIKFTIKPHLLEISTSNPELGEAKEEIEISYTGGALETGFNAKYFMDALNAMNTDQVTLELNDKLSPGILRGEGDSNYVCVVMPMRI